MHAASCSCACFGLGLPCLLSARHKTRSMRVQALTQKESVAKKKAAMSPDIAKALARLSSGLYVVTADSKGAKGAMVATCVTESLHIWVVVQMTMCGCSQKLEGRPLRVYICPL